MSTKVVNTQRTRNPRGRGGQLREELVQAAADLLSEPGPPLAVPLRAIARAVGVSPSAAYRFFPSQAHLVTAVIEERLAELAACIQDHDDPAAPPARRIEDACRAYAAWGVEHRGAYRLLFERPDVPDQPPDAGALLLDQLTTLLTQIDPLDAPARARRLWGAVHGLTSLAVHKGRSWSRLLDHDVEQSVRLHLPPGPTSSARR